MNANLEPEDPNEGSQRGGNPANSDPEVGGAEAAETAKLVSELDDLRQTLLRRQADFDNYRKRVEKERADDSKRSTARSVTTFAEESGKSSARPANTLMPVNVSWREISRRKVAFF